MHAAVTTVATSVAASSATGKPVNDAGGNTASCAGGGSPGDNREPLKEKLPHRVRRFHSAGRSKHRGADNSITQYALIDDDNLSQQVTRGGGGEVTKKWLQSFCSWFCFFTGLTLASQWKSQFDDSEETDNEWKQENLQSPEHRGHQREVCNVY